MLPTKFRFIWQSSFREDFLEINQSEIKIACGPILVSNWLITKKSSPLKPLGQMNQHLGGNILGRSSMKMAHLVPIG
jgi:hypothetical protein